jgi:hypothetical protein
MVIATGCSTPSAAPPTSDAAVDHGTVPTPPDAVAGRDSGFDAATEQTSLRLALLSSLGFGVDVCISSFTTGAQQGPLLYNQHQLQTQPDAGHDAAHDAAGAAETGGAPPDAAIDGASAGDAGATQTDATLDATLPTDATFTADAAHDATLDASGDGSTDAHDAMVSGADGASAIDGGTPFGGVLAEQVTNYLAIAGAGTFEVSIVPGGASTCACPLARRLVTFDSGKFYTLVVGALAPAGSDAGGLVDATATDAARSGDAALLDAAPADACAAPTSLSIVPLTDEPLLTATLARARFFNAIGFDPVSSNDAGAVGALRVAVVEQSAIVPLASRVPVDQVSSASPANPGVDALGYWTGTLSVTTSLVHLRVGPVTDVGGEAGVDGAVTAPFSSFVTSDGFDLVASTNHTGFLAGGGAAPLTLLWCNDSITLGAVYTSCELVTGQ